MSCEELAIFANLAYMAHVRKNIQIKFWYVYNPCLLAKYLHTIKTNQGLWDISANVKIFFGLFATYSLANFKC